MDGVWPCSAKLGNLAIQGALSDYRIVPVKDRQAAGVNERSGPFRSVVSRIRTTWTEATSTQAPPLSPE